MKKAEIMFHRYLSAKNLKQTQQREEILRSFLETENHVTTEDLYQIVCVRFPSVGYSTVYRALKLIVDSGIAREVDFGDGVLRYEHDYAHDHHDHLVCIRCGDTIEVYNSDIEAFQEKLCREQGFQPLRHKMEIFGLCPKCKQRGKVIS